MFSLTVLQGEDYNLEIIKQEDKQDVMSSIKLSSLIICYGSTSFRTNMKCWYLLGLPLKLSSSVCRLDSFYKKNVLDFFILRVSLQLSL